MKKYRVVGYIPAGLHRMKRIEKVVITSDPHPNDDSAVGAWLGALFDERLPGSPYEIESIEELKDND
ncbi:MAG: hypothetical protein J1E81_05945 [Eubacterium sp.]|nr:hypothetical protein [Eubacterium sp.]